MFQDDAENDFQQGEFGTSIRGGRQTRGGKASQNSSNSLVRDLAGLRCSNRDELMREIGACLEKSDSRMLSTVLRELLRRRETEPRAREVFDFLRCLPSEDPRSALLDVYTYTVMISGCSNACSTEGIVRANGIFKEMIQRDIDPNIHTHTALMNVFVKCGEPQLAIQQFKEMQRLGISPNVVTYNTLIDVYGKLGRWEDCVNVLSEMKRNGVDPVPRTYNTVMIACNSAGRTADTLNVYRLMLDNDMPPNTTSFNALISAYSKAHRFDMVWETYRSMIEQGCERTVITFSCLISACEKSGQWQLALRIFDEMMQEGCKPNVVTFNSLITACAESGMWQQALHVFNTMRQQGCDPDVITYTSVINAHAGPGHWCDAMVAFHTMRQEGIEMDDVVCDVLVEALWDSGVEGAQRRAVAEHRALLRRGLLRMLVDRSQPEAWELNLNGITFGTVVATLLATLNELWRIQSEIQALSGPGLHLVEAGAAEEPRRSKRQTLQLPETISVCLGKLKAKSADSTVLRTAFLALVATLGIPHRPTLDQKNQALMYLPTSEVLIFLERQHAEWQRSKDQGAQPAAPSADIARFLSQGDADNAATASGAGPAAADAGLRPFIHLVFEMEKLTAFNPAAPETERDRQAERQACNELQETLYLERFVSVDPAALTHAAPGGSRRALFRSLCEVCLHLGLDMAAAHDCMLVADRLVSAGHRAGGPELVAAAVALGLRWNHVEDLMVQRVGAKRAPQVLLEQGVDFARLAELAGLGGHGSAKDAMQAAQQALGGSGQTFVPSAYRVLADMLLPRLDLKGGVHRAFGRAAPSDPLQLLTDLVAVPELQRFRPSVLAAATMAYARISSGIYPFMPRAIHYVTGFKMSSPDVMAAVNAIRDLCTRQAMASGVMPTAALIQLTTAPMDAIGQGHHGPAHGHAHGHGHTHGHGHGQGMVAKMAMPPFLPGGGYGPGPARDPAPAPPRGGGAPSSAHAFAPPARSSSGGALNLGPGSNQYAPQGPPYQGQGQGQYTQAPPQYAQAPPMRPPSKPSPQGSGPPFQGAPYAQGPGPYAAPVYPSHAAPGSMMISQNAFHHGQPQAYAPSSPMDGPIAAMQPQFGKGPPPPAHMHMGGPSASNSPYGRAGYAEPGRGQGQGQGGYNGQPRSSQGAYDVHSYPPNLDQLSTQFSGMRH